MQIEQKFLQMELDLQSGKDPHLVKKNAEELKKQIKETKMDKTEKKEMWHRIIKIILEVLLNILTAGIPALTKMAKLKK